MQFSQVIGQEQVKKQLVDMVQSNRLSHALLFLGKEGTGGLPLAMAFSQYLTCEKVQKGNKEESGASLFGEPEPVPTIIPMDSCGQCAACVKASKMMHPDIHYSFPVIAKSPSSPPVCNDWITEFREFFNSMPYGNPFDWLQSINAENKQGNITAAECNDIIRKLSVKSFESGYKILVMWMPEYLGKEGNKLLKLIEEPPANTLFLLVAENESMILQTILSRTQLVKIPSLETSVIENTLVEKASLDPVRARQVAVLSEGNYREALQLLNNASEDWLSLLREWLNAILKNGPIAQVRWVEEISKLGREKQKQFLRYCNHMIEIAIRGQLINGSMEELPASERDFASKLNRVANISQQQAMIEEMDKASYYIERNANGKMLFHALTIRVNHIIADKSLILIG
jgi:DNA polymerase III subunit delta'